jgi:hypothetical protein
MNTEKNYVRSLNYLVESTNDAVPIQSSEIRHLHKRIAAKHGTAGANSAIKLLKPCALVNLARQHSHWFRLASALAFA